MLSARMKIILSQNSNEAVHIANLKVIPSLQIKYSFSQRSIEVALLLFFQYMYDSLI